MAEMELPPRARRIPRRPQRPGERDGTTSACAENTILSQTKLKGGRNYLRVRGEYRLASAAGHFGEELPPRARRIPEVAADPRSLVGTTSACAENTQRRRACVPHPGNYLRVRGEYMSP